MSVTTLWLRFLEKPRIDVCSHAVRRQIRLLLAADAAILPETRDRRSATSDAHQNTTQSTYVELLPVARSVHVHVCSASTLNESRGHLSSCSVHAS